MAAWKGTQYTITATATNLTTILGLTASQPSNSFKELKVRNATGATAALYLGPSTVTNVPANARIQVAAEEAATIGPFGGSDFVCNTDSVYLVGTVNAANIAFISVVF